MGFLRRVNVKLGKHTKQATWTEDRTPQLTSAGQITLANL